MLHHGNVHRCIHYGLSMMLVSLIKNEQPIEGMQGKVTKEMENIRQSELLNSGNSEMEVSCVYGGY